MQTVRLIKVNEDDIANAKFSKFNHDPIELAITRQTKFDHVEVYPDKLIIRGQSGFIFTTPAEVVLPKHAQKFITLYRAGHDMLPFEFFLRVDIKQHIQSNVA